MHILFIVGRFPELTFILRPAVTLAARGHHLTVAARSRGDWKPFKDALPLPPTLSVRYLLPEYGFSDPRRSAIVVRQLPRALLSSPRGAWRLLRLCRTHPRTRQAPWRHFWRHLPFMSMKADVIQFDFPMTAGTFPLVPEMLHAPMIVSCRGSDIHMLEQRSEAERSQRLDGIRRATIVHCVSDEMAGVVRRVSGRSDGLRVNRPAVLVSKIAPKAHYRHDGPPLILAIGALTWVKGFDYLLTALARLKRESMAFRAQIIGGGELQAVLRFSIWDLDLQQEVELCGKVPAAEVLERLRAADVFVLSSVDEGISNAALEAMASGLPIVTTAAGGMAEAVRDGVEGFVVPVRDIPAMADRIRRLLLDPALRERLGRAARARAEAEFTLERQADGFEQMYREVVGTVVDG